MVKLSLAPQRAGGSALEGARRHAAGVIAAALLTAAPAFVAPPAIAATDGAAIGSCLIQKAPGALARCVTDPTCLANLACIQTCTNRPDEATCQIACGDKFANGVTEAFTKAAVTEQKCVPQRQDDGSWPVPADSTLVTKFSASDLDGDWYISAGLNKAFDIFDCQLHRFSAPAPDLLVGNLQWRIKDPVAGTNFVTRYTVQTFKQDASRPGILYNHDNEFLHYQDDWYVLANRRAYDDAKGKGGYVVVYYRGSNDAWDGYGGAVIYTREPKLRQEYVPEISAALDKVGLRWADFTETDNSCNAAESRLEELEADFVLVESKVAGGFSTFEKLLVDDVVGLEKEIVKDVVGIEREIVRDAKRVEAALEDDVAAVEAELQTAAQKGIPSLFKRR